jgi:hypothetical protein
MALVLMTQYFDTLKEIGARSGSNTIFMPNQPGAANDFLNQIVAGLRSIPNAGANLPPRVPKPQE